MKVSKVLSIPIGAFVDGLRLHDLNVQLTSAGCAGGALRAQDLDVALDGVAPVIYKLPELPPNDIYFAWPQFPTAPQILQITYSGPATPACMHAFIYFIDGACEKANPTELCPL